MTVDLTALDAANKALQADPKAAKTVKQYAAANTATWHAAYPPPPPVVTSNGVGAIRVGAAYDPHEDLSWCSALIVDINGLSAPHEHPGVTTYLYRSIATCHKTYDSCIPWATADANGWLLKDASGALLTNKGYGGNIIDLSNAAAVQALLSNSLALANASGFAGIFYDDVNEQALTLCNAMPAGWTQDKWKTTWAAAARTLCDGLKQRGLKSGLNAPSYDSAAGQATDDGSLVAGWWQYIGSSPTAFQRESWEQSPVDPAVLYPDDPSLWYGYWPGWRKLHTLCRNMGCEFWAGVYGAADGPELLYARATSLLDDGPCITFSQGTTGKGGWCKDEGAALAPASQAGKVWTRQFARGTVTVLTASPAPSATL